MISIDRLKLMARRPPELLIAPRTISVLRHLAQASAPSELYVRALQADLVAGVRFLRTHGILDRTTETRMMSLEAAVRGAKTAGILQFISQALLQRGVGEDLPGIPFSRARFLRHCAFVGSFCRTYATIRPLPGVSPDTAYMFGAAHDIGTIELAKLAPEVFTSVSSFARQCGTSFDVAFSCSFPESIHSLGAIFATNWRLQREFSGMLSRFDQDTLEPDDDLLAVVLIADWLSSQNNATWEQWPAMSVLPLAIAERYTAEREFYDDVARQTLEYLQSGFAGVARPAA